MGKVIIDLVDSIELRISAKNITEAIEKLTTLNNRTINPAITIDKYKGIARYTEPINEEEWYQQ
jgi:hypothetical protein